MYIKSNPNPDNLMTEDCTIRAISIATDKSWDETYIDVCIKGFVMKRMPSTNSVWAEYLKDQGFSRHIIPDTCPHCYTVRDFCGEYFKGTYVLGTGSHAIAVIDGDYYDAWDSGDEVPLYYFKKET